MGCVLLGAALLGACGQSETPGPGDKARAPAASACPVTSWVAGTTELCGGALIYRDYVYDDHGADTNPAYNSPIGDLSPVAGDATYPAGSENTADLVRLELAPVGNRLTVTAELNTLYAADSTQLVLAIDTDADATTGGGEWPGLGIRSEGWDLIQAFANGDPDSNLITGSLPLPPGETWRVQAVVAQADGTVMNVAFRGPDEEAKGLTAAGVNQGTYWEDKQGAALAAGDISAFGYTVALQDLRQRVRKAEAVGPGLHQRVYTSQYTLPPGEGISVDGVPGRHGDTGNPCEQYFHFLGKYQPYGIYLPSAPGPHGVQFALHGCAANHASLINNTGMQTVFGEGLNRILFVPLARGPQGYYSDISERDVLDAYADLLASYPIDQDRVFSGGYSMGGYGTLRFAALYPQLFAGAVNWVGFTGDISNTPLPGNPIPPNTSEGGSRNGAEGNVIDFIGNLRHIPTASLYSGEDELVQVTTGLAMMQAFANAADVVYEFFLHPVAEHLTFALLDDWRKEAAYSAPFTRVSNPQRVTYRTDAALDFPQYAIRHDRAYWISAIVGRDAGYVDVDLASLACRNETASFEEGSHAGEDPLPWVSEYRVRSGVTAATTVARLEGTLANVASLTIDAAATCLESGSVGYAITTDGPVIVRLSNGRTLSLAAAGTHEGSF
jgi:dienelactone hydrolase